MSHPSIRIRESTGIIIDTRRILAGKGKSKKTLNEKIIHNSSAYSPFLRLLSFSFLSPSFSPLLLFTPFHSHFLPRLPFIWSLHSLPPFFSLPQTHPELQEIPVFYASKLALKALRVYQTFVNMMNEHIRGTYTSFCLFVYLFVSLFVCLFILFIHFIYIFLMSSKLIRNYHKLNK